VSYVKDGCESRMSIAGSAILVIMVQEGEWSGKHAITSPSGLGGGGKKKEAVRIMGMKVDRWGGGPYRKNGFRKPIPDRWKRTIQREAKGSRISEAIGTCILS